MRFESDHAGGLAVAGVGHSLSCQIHVARERPTDITGGLVGSSATTSASGEPRQSPWWSRDWGRPRGPSHLSIDPQKASRAFFGNIRNVISCTVQCVNLSNFLISDQKDN